MNNYSVIFNLNKHDLDFAFSYRKLGKSFKNISEHWLDNIHNTDYLPYNLHKFKNMKKLVVNYLTNNVVINLVNLVSLYFNHTESDFSLNKIVSNNKNYLPKLCKYLCYNDTEKTKCLLNEKHIKSLKVTNVNNKHINNLYLIYTDDTDILNLTNYYVFDINTDYYYRHLFLHSITLKEEDLETPNFYNSLNPYCIKFGNIFIKKMNNIDKDRILVKLIKLFSKMSIYKCIAIISYFNKKVFLKLLTELNVCEYNVDTVHGYNFNFLDEVLQANNVYDYNSNEYDCYYLININKNNNYIKSYKLYKNYALQLLKTNKRLTISDLAKN